MKKVVRIATSLAMIPISYLVWSFVAAELNPLEWGADGRLSMIVVGLWAAVCCYNFPEWTK